MWSRCWPVFAAGGAQPRSAARPLVAAGCDRRINCGWSATVRWVAPSKARPNACTTGATIASVAGHVRTSTKLLAAEDREIVDHRVLARQSDSRRRGVHQGLVGLSHAGELLPTSDPCGSSSGRGRATEWRCRSKTLASRRRERTSRAIIWPGFSIGSIREAPLSLWGHSFGARAVTGALHLLGGGQLCGHVLDERVHAERAPAQVVLLAAALDNDWMMPGHFHGQALSQTSQLAAGQQRLRPPAEALSTGCMAAARAARHWAIRAVSAAAASAPSSKVTQIDACCDGAASSTSLRSVWRRPE